MLTLPLLVLLGLGLLQLGSVLWSRVLLQHAAQSAARAYTVWLPLDPDEARTRALRAAQMALGSAWSGQALDLDIRQGSPRQAGPFDAGQPGVHQLSLQATLRIPGPLGSRWDLQASSAILREEGLVDVTDGD
jgi:hypothetical protein